ncbi:MAG TPA: type II secretion system F family protein [Bacteroidota bacterium]|nr:type II secretion system F family protein [Bacteroidota bacterium]
MADTAPYQIIAKEASGKPVQGFITATSSSDARRRAKLHPRFKDSTLVTVRKKKNYAYRVRHGTKTIDGFQSAYTRQEVVAALERIGFDVRWVRRHYEIKFKAASNEIVSFVGTSARLLEQKLPYTEVLQVMVNSVKDKNMKVALRDIILDLKNGVDSREAFQKQGKIFGEHTALMLGIASKSGDMTMIFRSVAALVERQAEFKKGLTSALILPAVTSLTLVGAIAFYVLFLLPKMMKLMGPLLDEVPPITQFTLNLSAWVQDNFILLIVGSLLVIVGFYAYIVSPQGRLQMHKFIVKVPYVGKILRNTSTEIFCRVLGIMYASAGENIEAIQLAAESSGNRWLALQIRTVAIPTMLKYGTELAKALESVNFFPEMFISRFKTAAETGAVKDTANQLADFYQMENHYAMKNMISFIEVMISVIIMASMIFLTLLSSETASMNIRSM